MSKSDEKKTEEQVFEEAFEGIFDVPTSGVLMDTQVSVKDFEPVVMALTHAAIESHPGLDEKLVAHRPIVVQDEMAEPCESCGETHGYLCVSYFSRSIEDMHRLRDAVAREAMAIERERMKEGRLQDVNIHKGMTS